MKHKNEKGKQIYKKKNQDSETKKDTTVKEKENKKNKATNIYKIKQNKKKIKRGMSIPSQMLKYN